MGEVGWGEWVRGGEGEKSFLGGESYVWELLGSGLGAG